MANQPKYHSRGKTFDSFTFSIFRASLGPILRMRILNIRSHQHNPWKSGYQQSRNSKPSSKTPLNFPPRTTAKTNQTQAECKPTAQRSPRSGAGRAGVRIRVGSDGSSRWLSQGAPICNSLPFICIAKRSFFFPLRRAREYIRWQGESRWIASRAFCILPERRASSALPYHCGANGFFARRRGTNSCAEGEYTRAAPRG